jgi:hypothetical protein
MTGATLYSFLSEWVSVVESVWVWGHQAECGRGGRHFILLRLAVLR